MELKKTVVQGAGEALGSAFNFNRTVTSLNLAGNLLGMELGKMGHHCLCRKGLTAEVLYGLV